MKHRILIIIALFFVLVSCGTLDFSDQPQGIIEYDVTYVTNKSSMPTNLLPKHVVLKFHAHKSITTIEGFMGMFIFSNISDFKRHTNITLLKVIDKKYYYEGSKNEYPIFFEDMSKIKIINTNDKNIIAGLTCKKALIT